ncbi:MAG: Hydrogen peroxide-inducible activator [Labilithrix sp.]|nr:Hydrogen peroxide-inducible activator [Labilithrix sp.]
MSISDLSLRQLEYVVAVADTLGFRKAAERCGVSQPTLSAQIAQLEGVLGVTLFERGRSSGVLLTPAGEIIVSRARRVLLETGDLLAAATRARDPFEGSFRVGVIPTVAPYYLPEVTQVLARAYPHLRLVLREEKTEDAVRDLWAGTIDVALLALVDEVRDLDHAKVLDDPFVVALPRGHALARKKKVTQADLDGEDVLLLDDGHCFRSQALAVCNRAGAHEMDLRATSLSTLVQMVAGSTAVTLLPELAVDVENRRAQLEIRRFAEPVPSRTIALVWRPQSPFAEAFRKTAATLRAAHPAAARHA